MHDIALIKAVLRIDGTELSLDRLSSTFGPEPYGSVDIENDVPPSILGYWVDMLDYKNRVIYRRYLTNVMPMNLKHVSRHWELSKRRMMRFKFEVPAFSHARSISIYEQSLTCKEDKLPIRKQHLTIGLKENVKAPTYGALCLTI